MRLFEVAVTASFPSDVQLLLLLTEAPRGPEVQGGVPHWETSARRWTTEEDARIEPVRHTLRVFYADIEGRDEAEAERFARSIFTTEWRHTSLPEPETIVALAE